MPREPQMREEQEFYATYDPPTRKLRYRRTVSQVHDAGRHRGRAASRDITDDFVVLSIDDFLEFISTGMQALSADLALFAKAGVRIDPATEKVLGPDGSEIKPDDQKEAS